MTNFTSNAQNFTARPGLYRVWVPLRDDGRAPLISIWIDPRMTAFEPQPHQESIELSETSEGAMAEEIEDPKRRIAVAAIVVNVAAETVQ
jgi:hypothetical protein